MHLSTEQVRQYAIEGVIHCAQGLSKPCLASAQQAYEWSLAHPGPGASRLPSGGDGEFYQDLANPAAFAAYDDLIRQADIIDLVQPLFSGPDVWFMYEQVFKKHGGATRRTPWHQDTSYLPVSGDDLAVMWITLDPVDHAHALEFVVGSHQGTLFNGSRFDPNDDTAPLYPDAGMPRLPDIEGNRASWTIKSWACEPGDVVIFHPSLLHGGAQTEANAARRTLSLRFFGARSFVARRPGSSVANPKENTHPLTLMRQASQGAPFRHPQFPKIA